MQIHIEDTMLKPAGKAIKKADFETACNRLYLIPCLVLEVEWKFKRLFISGMYRGVRGVPGGSWHHPFLRAFRPGLATSLFHLVCFL